MQRETLIDFLPAELRDELEQFKIGSEFGPIPPAPLPPHIVTIDDIGTSWAWDGRFRRTVAGEKHVKGGKQFKRHRKVPFARSFSPLTYKGMLLVGWEGIRKGTKHKWFFVCDVCGFRETVLGGHLCRECASRCFSCNRENESS